MAGLFSRLFGAGRSGGSRPAGASGAAVSGAAAAFSPGAAAWLVVGLGNPGRPYAGTRHNAGFEAVARLADRLGVRLGARVDGADVALAETRGVPVALACPQTFMNRSGGPAADLLARLALPPERLLVVYDDLALPLGALRLRPRGGAGGHNGVQSVTDELEAALDAAPGSVEYPRLRIGIGDSFAAGRQADYVLAPFSADEQDAADAAFDRAADAVLAVVHDGVPAAMALFNRRG